MDVATDGGPGKREADGPRGFAFRRSARAAAAGDLARRRGRSGRWPRWIGLLVATLVSALLWAAIAWGVAMLFR